MRQTDGTSTSRAATGALAKVSWWGVCRILQGVVLRGRNTFLDGQRYLSLYLFHTFLRLSSFPFSFLCSFSSTYSATIQLQSFKTRHHHSLQFSYILFETAMLLKLWRRSGITFTSKESGYDFVSTLEGYNQVSLHFYSSHLFHFKIFMEFESKYYPWRFYGQI